MSGPELIAVLGPPGAGKSVVAAQLLRGHPAHHAVLLAADRYRAVCSPYRDEADQAVTEAAFAALHRDLDHTLRRGRRAVVDATNARREHRGVLLRIATRHRAPARAVLVLPELQLARARNFWRPRNRGCGFDRRVPAEILTAMHTSLAAARGELATEGWDEVTELGG